MAAQKFTNATVVEAAGRSMRIDEWSLELGCPVQTIISRLERNWDRERAVTEPTGEAPSNRGKKIAPEVLIGDEITQLLAAAPKGRTSTRDRAMIVTSYRAGLRCCEVLALKLKDVDRQARTIAILHGKGDKRRVVGIDSQAWSIVEEWITERHTLGLSSEAPLFCTLAGGPINPRQVRAMMSRRGKRAKLEKHIHFHGLRHTMASEMMAEGVPLLDIAGALGHSNVSTTNRYLQQLNPTSVLNAMRERGWGRSSSTPTIQASAPAPDWLQRLRADIGERLMLFHDARSDEQQFKAVVLLF